MKSIMDEVLIDGIIQKNEESIKRFVQSYQDQVYHQAYRMLGTSEDTEEACQDIFLKAINKMEDFKKQSKLSTWLYRITYTTCLDVLKKRKRKPIEQDIDHVELPSWTHMEDALVQIEQQEQRSMIDQAILKLDETDAMFIDLYHLQELSIQEIAEIASQSRDSIKVRLFRARKKLAVILSKSLPLETLNTLNNE